mgnify:CR=1 FL=1
MIVTCISLFFCLVLTPNRFSYVIDSLSLLFLFQTGFKGVVSNQLSKLGASLSQLEKVRKIEVEVQKAIKDAKEKSNHLRDIDELNSEVE